MTRKAAIYARVSTDEQADKGYSLPSQIEACKRFSEQRGLDLFGVYQDDISGAMPIANRPEGKVLQDEITSGHVRAVIIYQVDRLSRDIVDLLTTIRQWLRAGIDVYALDVGQITSELNIVLVIKGWQGSDERQKIIERTTRGRNGKARAGKVVGAGSPAYGYTYADGELFINEHEAETVRLIYQWYVEGDETGKTLGMLGIAIRLSEMGILTPSEARGRKKYRKRAVGIWDKSTVCFILTSETYCGVLRYGKYAGQDGIGGKRPPEEHIIVNVPAIISRDVWEAAQEQRSRNSFMARRNAKRSYLLRGMIRCGCGGAFVGGHGNYYCSMRYNRYEEFEQRCQEPTVKGRIIEPLVWSYVMDLITDPEKFEERLRVAKDKENDAIQPKQKELEHVDALIEQTEIEAEDIAITLGKVKGIVAEKLTIQAEEVDRRYQALLSRRAKIVSALNAKTLSEKSIVKLLEFREIVAVGLENPTFADKQHWLEILQVQVKVINNMATITCRLPIDPVTFDLESENNPGGPAGGGSIKFKSPRNGPRAGQRWSRRRPSPEQG